MVLDTAASFQDLTSNRTLHAQVCQSVHAHSCAAWASPTNPPVLLPGPAPLYAPAASPCAPSRPHYPVHTTPPTQQVSLSFLRSYEGMGVADVACVAGCSCVPATLDGTWDKRVSLQHILPIYVRPAWHEAGGELRGRQWLQGRAAPSTLAPTPTLAPPAQPTRHERCRVCVTIAERPGAVAQQGHKVSLTAVMVSHWLLSLQRYESQLAEVHEQLHS